MGELPAPDRKRAGTAKCYRRLRSSEAPVQVGPTIRLFPARGIRRKWISSDPRRAIERRVRQARFPVLKSLDSFEFLAIPSLNKAVVLELARGEFIGRRENVLLLGNSGTGKTHIALALGLAACQHGHRVRFTTAAALV